MRRLSALFPDTSDELDQEHTFQDGLASKRTFSSILMHYVPFLSSAYASLFATRELKNDKSVHFSKELLDARRTLLGLEEDDQTLQFFDPKLQFPMNKWNDTIAKITHCRQISNWDCGVACCQMVLRWIKEMGESDDDSFEVDMNYEVTRYGYSSKLTEDEKIEREWMLEALQTESIWTIDLATLLHRIFLSKEQGYDITLGEMCLFKELLQNDLNISLLFCTKNAGVNPTHGDLKYYEGDFPRDVERVKSLFQYTTKQKVAVLEVNSLRVEHVADFVSKRNCIAIALFDNNILEQSRPKTKLYPLITLSEEKFTGHFTVICGVSTDERDIAECKWSDKKTKYCFIIKNPGSTNATDYISPNHFEQAWSTKGTDDDIIFIALKK